MTHSSLANNRGSIYYPTVNLRFIELQTADGIKRILQQKWVNDYTGNYRWLDVPVEKEENTEEVQHAIHD